MKKRDVPVCDYDGSTYQRDFWDAGDREYEDQVEAVAIKRLMPKRGSRLLEVGAGAGRNTLRYTGFDQIVLLDYSRTQLEQAQARLGVSDRFIYVAADVYRLPFDSAVFDAATMIRTLHHLAEPGDALRNIHYSLAPGGAFVLEYANKQNFKAILRCDSRIARNDPALAGPDAFKISSPDNCERGLAFPCGHGSYCDRRNLVHCLVVAAALARSGFRPAVLQGSCPPSTRRCQCGVLAGRRTYCCSRENGRPVCRRRISENKHIHERVQRSFEPVPG